MSGAIFYATRYGSTRDYAHWIAKATGLEAFDMDDGAQALQRCDFVVLGCPVIYHKLLGSKWIRRHLDEISRKPVILFTVSGAMADAKLDGWIANSLPQNLIDHAHHFALGGRQNPKELTLFDRTMLIVGGLFNPDRKAGREELKGFDFMDKASIQPVVDLIERWKSGEAAKAPPGHDTKNQGNASPGN
ncbi:MAG: hypothetical protein HKN18_08615 [Silicimonas sp.]|nr:hypothetical protein [Silicimonas sp.]